MSNRNRGKHPNDDKLFTAKWQAIIKEAVVDLSYLLTKGYGDKSSLQLVGNRYRLNSRQQKALMRLSADTNKIAHRLEKVVAADKLVGKSIAIDGFNLLILLENVLSGAYVFKCLDNTYRDISSVHGSYKKVMQTEESIIVVGKILDDLGVKAVHWIFDAPVSNSGRLRALLLKIAAQHGFPWLVSLDNNPDALLAESDDIVVSSDAWILDRCTAWFNFGKYLIEEKLKAATIIYAA